MLRHFRGFWSQNVSAAALSRRWISTASSRRTGPVSFFFFVCRNWFKKKSDRFFSQIPMGFSIEFSSIDLSQSIQTGNFTDLRSSKRRRGSDVVTSCHIFQLFWGGFKSVMVPQIIQVMSQEFYSKPPIICH